MPGGILRRLPKPVFRKVAWGILGRITRRVLGIIPEKRRILKRLVKIEKCLCKSSSKHLMESLQKILKQSRKSLKKIL